ncbi:class I SAM-dependent methyltransferase [Prevotella melaninogenica]
MIIYRFLSLCFVHVLAVVFCYAQQVETDYLTVKGNFDLDKLEDKMYIVRKTVFNKDEEGYNNLHASEVYIRGKICLGNKTTLSFIDHDDLDESRGGELTYISPIPGIIIRNLKIQNGPSVMIVYDYYMFAPKHHNWYKYKTATYNQTQWDSFHVTFDYYDKVQKPLIGSKEQTISTIPKDPMLPKKPLKLIIQECEKGYCPKTYLNFIYYIEFLNHIDIEKYERDIRKLAMLIRSYNESWGNYIITNYLKRH